MIDWEGHRSVIQDTELADAQKITFQAKILEAGLVKKLTYGRLPVSTNHLRLLLWKGLIHAVNPSCTYRPDGQSREDILQVPQIYVREEAVGLRKRMMQTRSRAPRLKKRHGKIALHGSTPL